MIDPVTSLPFNIAKKFRETAHYLLADLEDNKFHVRIVPAPDPQHANHKVRQVEVSNPYWYSRIYFKKSKGNMCRGKKSRGRQGQIRQRVGLALLRIMNGKDGRHVGRVYSYDRMLRELIKKMLCEGYETNFGEVPSDEEAVEYFTEK